jgi:hypothetical protein
LGEEYYENFSQRLEGTTEMDTMNEYEEDLIVNGQFVANGCCILDFYLLWTKNAIRQENPELAYKYSRLLAHSILSLIQPQRPLDENSNVWLKWWER